MNILEPAQQLHRQTLNEDLGQLLTSPSVQEFYFS